MSVSDRGAEISLAIYLDNASQVVHVLKEHCKRIDAARLCLNTLHHIGTAATAFIFGATRLKKARERVELLEQLEFLTQILAEMSPTYQPAERMFCVLDNVLTAFDDSTGRTRKPDLKIPRPLVPARRASSVALEPDINAVRKRQFDPAQLQQSSNDLFAGLHAPERWRTPSELFQASITSDMGNLSPFYSWSSFDPSQNLVADFNDMSRTVNGFGGAPNHWREDISRQL